MPNSFDSTDLLRKEFEGASDRAAAVVAGAFLDELLGELLREFFVDDPANDKKLFKVTGALATFSAKIDIAYRLGLISVRECEIIRDIKSIRDGFAHKLSGVSFEDQSVAARCKHIETPVAMVAPQMVPLSQTGEVPPLPTIEKADSNNSRAIFQEAVITLMHALAARVADASRSKCTSPIPFVAAHEPAERLLVRLQGLMERYQSLAESKVLSAEDKAGMAKDIGNHQLLIRVQEFCVRQIKAAHEALSRQG